MEYTLYQLLWFFLVYSFLGWLMETAAAAAKKGKLLNRGFLNAPFSPVYGEAAVLFAVFLPELKSAPFFLFVGGMLLATALELVTGALLERIFGQKWWDYSQEPWNFNGHICLKYSLVWGLLALFCLSFPAFLAFPVFGALIVVRLYMGAVYSVCGSATMTLAAARSPGGGGRCPTPWTTRSPGTSSGVWPGPTPAWTRTA